MDYQTGLWEIYLVTGDWSQSTRPLTFLIHFKIRFVISFLRFRRFVVTKHCIIHFPITILSVCDTRLLLVTWPRCHRLTLSCGDVFSIYRVPSYENLILIRVICKKNIIIKKSQRSFRIMQKIMQYCKILQLNLVMLNTAIPLPLQTAKIEISWLLKKPTDLDLHCLPLRLWIYNNNPDQAIWLAENWKWVLHLNLFSMTRVKTRS